MTASGNSTIPACSIPQLATRRVRARVWIGDPSSRAYSTRIRWPRNSVLANAPTYASQPTRAFSLSSVPAIMSASIPAPSITRNTSSWDTPSPSV